MGARVLIAGQGLAGTLLAWELEAAGIDFEIVDPGHERAASRVAAGLINPVTGRRLVKSWRVETLRPVARERYQAIEYTLGVRLWHEMRVRRFFADEHERRVANEKHARGELAGYVNAIEDDGFWIEGAARVDVAELLRASRARWTAAGRLRIERVDWSRAREDGELVIDCTGAGAFLREGGEWSGAAIDSRPWRFSHGECLTLAIDGLADDVVLNRRHWLVPIGPGRAKVGATNVPGRCDVSITDAAHEELLATMASFGRQSFRVIDHEAGLRVYVDDKRPVIGRDPRDWRRGVFNGLGAKGVLLAPELARQWARHLVDGAEFAPEFDVARLFRGSEGGGLSR